MTIWYPIPVRCLSYTQALKEHFDIVQTQLDIIDGKQTELSERWKSYQPALYDRFLSGRRFLLERVPSSELLFYPGDLSTAAILLGGDTLVYPEIPEKEVLDMWEAIFVANTGIEY